MIKGGTKQNVNINNKHIQPIRKWLRENKDHSMSLFLNNWIKIDNYYYIIKSIGRDGGQSLMYSNKENQKDRNGNNLHILLSTSIDSKNFYIPLQEHEWFKIETYTVNVHKNENGHKIYMCPLCKSISGTAFPKNPTNLTLFSHSYNCPNKNKFPVETKNE